MNFRKSRFTYFSAVRIGNLKDRTISVNRAHPLIFWEGGWSPSFKSLGFEGKNILKNHVVFKFDAIEMIQSRYMILRTCDLQ